MTEVQGRRVLVVGLARSGRAAARCFRRQGARVTVSDSRPPSAFQAEIPELIAQRIGLELGLHRETTFLRQDVIVVSPGVYPEPPALQAARKRKVRIVPEIEAASWFLKGRLVGITGTNGKTTTTALLGKMLEASGFPTFVGGNIGVPLISAVDHDSPNSLLVAELSSFQLEAIQDFRPQVAVLLNLTSNHLDRHPSFDAYVRAKAQVFRNQTADDYAILNADDPTVMSLAPAIASRKVFFSRGQDLPDGVFVSNGQIRYRAGNLERVLMEIRDIPLRGAFNVENVLAAAAVACVVGADFEALRRAVRDFQGVEHRLEYVREIRGVEFYNDSKATSVDATVKALSAFDRGVHLILGGKDKGAPYVPLRSLLEGRVRYAYLIGAAAERLARELSAAAELVRSGDLESAVRQAFKLAVPGDVVLLAPACASFDQFRDYEHRGRVFKELVGRIAQEAELADAERLQKETTSAAPPEVPAVMIEPEPAKAISGTPELPRQDVQREPGAQPEVATASEAGGGDLGPLALAEPELPAAEVAGLQKGPAPATRELAAPEPAAEEPQIMETTAASVEPADLARVTEIVPVEVEEVSKPSPVTVESQKDSDEGVQGTPESRPAELVYVYETGAEEATPLEIEPPAESQEDESEPVTNLRPPETVEDESLPFEIHATAGASTPPPQPSEGVATAGPREAETPDVKPGAPVEGPTGQGRLPGI